MSQVTRMQRRITGRMQLLAIVMLLAACTIVAPGEVLSQVPAVTIAPSVAAQGYDSSEWSTVAGNPQRTSWVSTQVDTSNLQVEWYRPIEAYIPQNVQVITANGLLYISTSRGLYALYATDPDGNGPLLGGDEAWRFDTDMPLGNSPTVVGGVAYVGGFDRKLHALDALTGAHLWSFDGAGAGYGANPLVVDGKIFVGNRDGFMYAIGAHGTPQQGQLIWKFNAGAPIVLSAAYNNGVVYFSSDDNYAFAINANGVKLWRSARMLGEGFYSYWPVTFQDKVIFTGSTGYRHNSDPGTGSLKDGRADCAGGCPYDAYDRLQKDDIFFDKAATGGTVGPVVNEVGAWAQGKTVVDGSRLTEYMEDNPNPDPHLHKPWRRSVIVLNAGDGSEYTFDSDSDGYREYAPFAFWGTRNGSMYPPIVGPDDVLYQSNIYSTNGSTWDIPQGQVMGWKVGSSRLSLVSNQGATDEPQAISAGGNTLFRSILADRVGSAHPLLPGGGPDRYLWHYGDPLALQAPGYDMEWWGTDGSGLPRLEGNYGTRNGIYHNHGVQNPIVPYQDRLFTHRSNSIIAYGPSSGPGMRPELRAGSGSVASVIPSPQQVRNRLEEEVRKMMAAGNLRPGYYNNGQAWPFWLNSYFENPGDTLYTLAVAYPYLSSELQGQVKSYLLTEFQTYFDPTMYSRRGWSEGNPREAMSVPPEVASSMSRGNKSTWPGDGWSWAYPQQNFYAMWKFAQVLGSDPYVQHIYDLAKSKIQVPVPSTADFQKWPWELNGYIGGYVGFLNLQNLAGKSTEDAALGTTVQSELNRLLSLRATGFTKDTYWMDPSNAQLPAHNGDYHARAYNISRNFIMLTPELGDYLAQHAFTRVQEAVTEYQAIAPYWFVSRYDAAVDEGAMQNLYDPNALLVAKAYVLKQSYGELAKYLDAPAFSRGDLFYIQNLVVALGASGSALGLPDPIALPSSTPTAPATPTAVPTMTSNPTVVPTIAATPTVVPPTATTVIVPSPTLTPTHSPTVSPTAPPQATATPAPTSVPTEIKPTGARTRLKVEASPESVASGGSVTVTWSDVTSPSGADWVGLFKVGTSDSSRIDWVYLSGSKVAGEARKSGSAIFKMPSTAGNYEFRLFTAGTRPKQATSNRVTVR